MPLIKTTMILGQERLNDPIGVNISDKNSKLESYLMDFL